jgi:hypothetical protein
MTVVAIVQTVHIIAIKVLERVFWWEDGRTHLWLDGVPMVPFADEPFDESVMALVPKSTYAPLPDNFTLLPGAAPSDGTDSPDSPLIGGNAAAA